MHAHLPEGFTYRERKSGEVEVLHFGKLATVLRGRRAEKFGARVSEARELELQHLMTSVTGNDEHGNERPA